jgi:hypothetical protein
MSAWMKIPYLLLLASNWSAASTLTSTCPRTQTQVLLSSVFLNDPLMRMSVVGAINLIATRAQALVYASHISLEANLRNTMIRTVCVQSSFGNFTSAATRFPFLSASPLHVVRF